MAGPIVALFPELLTEFVQFGYLIRRLVRIIGENRKVRFKRKSAIYTLAE